MDVPFDELVSHQLRCKLRVRPVSQDVGTSSTPCLHQSPDSARDGANQSQRVEETGAPAAMALAVNQPVENANSAMAVMVQMCLIDRETMRGGS